MAINNIDQLRENALKTLMDLEKGKIDTAEAGVKGKLYESVISTIKTQLQYAQMLNKEPLIPFMGDLSKNKSITIEGKIDKKLTHS